MKISAIPTGPFQEICYIVWDETKQALVFDPGCDDDLIHRALDENKLQVAAYICTHGHADHINALATMHASRPAPIAMHSKDLDWAFGPINQIAPYYSVPRKPDVDRFLLLDESKDWHFDNLYFQRMETPGHTPGSCCILFPEGNLLIAGDTLFKGSCGRTDLPGGNPSQLKQSLNKLKQLPDDIRVFPGHGEDTTIGTERATNIYMQ